MTILRDFLRNRSGAYAMMLGILSVPLLLGVGLAVDYSRLLRAHGEMQELADGAALALAASRETDETRLRRMAEDYVQANAMSGVFERLSIETLDTSDEDRVEISLDGDVRAYFMSLANKPTLNTKTLAVAVRGISGSVEVALVLDNTDSMNQDNKIGALKTAAGSLVEELFEEKEADIRIALVPYGEQINIGKKHRNAPWLSVPDDYTKRETVPAYSYQPMKSTGVCKRWNEAGSGQQERDGVMVAVTWGRHCAEWEMVANGPRVSVPEQTRVTKHEWHGCIGSRVAAGRLLLEDDSLAIPYPGFVDTKQRCLTEVLPLTGKKNPVKKAIEGMITSRPGYTPQTYIPGGLMWGINVLSPQAPFNQGGAYDEKNAKPRKVIVLMTDGLNTRRVNLTGTLNVDFLEGGALLGDYAGANAAQKLQTNADTTTLCEYAKARKIEIFTVAFKVDDGPAKTMLQSCATDPSHYYDAGNSEALMTAFSDIARSLVRVRLAE